MLRLGDDVSYVYRHENAMVLLRQETWDEYRREHGEAGRRPGAPAADGRRRPLARLLQPR